MWTLDKDGQEFTGMDSDGPEYTLRYGHWTWMVGQEYTGWTGLVRNIQVWTRMDILDRDRHYRQY